MRRMLGSLVAVLILASWASAQAPIAAQLRWTAGQVLLYRMEHTTETADVMGELKSEMKNVLKVTKRWQVQNVDAAGVATLQLSVTAMYQERTTTSGDVVKFDSADLDKSTPELKAAMAKYLNTPLATIRVDGHGKVVEVKESKSDGSSFESELPFFVLLPTAGVKANDAWERAYKITLLPPLGAGEKSDAVQKYRCKSASADTATFALTTELKTPPAAKADEVPLWRFLPEGEVVFDVKNGRMESAKLSIAKELKNLQGENTSVSFKSTLTVTYAGEK